MVWYGKIWYSMTGVRDVEVRPRIAAVDSSGKVGLI